MTHDPQPAQQGMADVDLIIAVATQLICDPLFQRSRVRRCGARRDDQCGCKKSSNHLYPPGSAKAVDAAIPAGDRNRRILLERTSASGYRRRSFGSRLPAVPAPPDVWRHVGGRPRMHDWSDPHCELLCRELPKAAGVSGGTRDMHPTCQPRRRCAINLRPDRINPGLRANKTRGFRRIGAVPCSALTAVARRMRADRARVIAGRSGRLHGPDAVGTVRSWR